MVKGEIVVENVIEREPGFLYYLDKEGNVCRSPMAVGGKKGALKPRSKTKDELRLLNKERQRKFRALKKKMEKEVKNEN